MARSKLFWLTLLILFSLPVQLYAASAAAPAPPSLAGASGLEAQYRQLLPALQNNPFNRPLVLQSSEEGNTVRGDIHAVLDHPFDDVRRALATPTNWCDILILHLNTKYCQLSGAGDKTMLRLQVGKKTEQALKDTYRVDFNYRAGSNGGDYLSSTMQAAEGPLGTSDYRIQIEAIPLPEGRALLHLSYSYTYGMTSKLAMRAYLMTMGRDKVGFSIAARKSDGQIEYVSGTRASIERNTMRYYLAIDAWLASQQAAPGERVERRLLGWFDATEQYPRQLHEIDRADYLAMKRNELARQAAP